MDRQQPLDRLQLDDQPSRKAEVEHELVVDRRAFVVQREPVLWKAFDPARRFWYTDSRSPGPISRWTSIAAAITTAVSGSRSSDMIVPLVGNAEAQRTQRKYATGYQCTDEYIYRKTAAKTPAIALFRRSTPYGSTSLQQRPYATFCNVWQRFGN
jgi:hypothetical protein